MNRTIAIAAALALAACAPATSVTSIPDLPPSSVETAPEGNASVISTGDGMHVITSTETRVLRHDISAPVDRVWAVLPEVYLEMGLGGTPNAGARTVTSPSVSFTRRMFGQPAGRFFDCGRGQFGSEIAATHTIHLILRTTVQPGGSAGAAQLETVAQAYARNNDGANSLMSRCHTRGLLEGMVALRVREKLAEAN